MSTPNPLLVTKSSIKPIPRLSLWLICCSYVLVGFLFQEPWQGVNITSYSEIKLLAEQNFSWLTYDSLKNKHLSFWLASNIVRLIEHPLSYKLIFILCLAAILYSTRLCVYYLAQTKAALPINLVFADNVNPKEYATVIADAGLLAMIANLGLVTIGHELTPVLFQLFAVNCLILSVAINVKKTSISLLCLMISSLLLTFSHNPFLGNVLLIVAMVCLLKMQSVNIRYKLLYIFCSIFNLIFNLIVIQYDQYFFNTNSLNTTSYISWIKLFFWFFWPCWFITVLGIWQWRHQLTQPHILLPLSFTIIICVFSITNSKPSNILFLALSSLSILTAFALPTIKRNISSFIDWLTLLLFTATALFLWIMWFAGVFGIPQQLHKNISKQLDYQMQWQTLPLILAILVSILWINIIKWRTSRHPKVVWKSLILPACGITFCWFLINSIWLTPLNLFKSDKHIIQQIFHTIPINTKCIYNHQLPNNLINAIYYYQSRLLTNINEHDNCSWLISKDNSILDNQWQLTKEIQPLNLRQDKIFIYYRLNN